MKNVFIKICFFCLVLQNCAQQRMLGMADWIEQTNATPVQKQALYDGCSYPYMMRQRQTILRDVGGVNMNPYYMQNSEYTGNWRDGMWICYMGMPAVDNTYLRDWNILGFKGDSIAYKGN